MLASPGSDICSAPRKSTAICARVFVFDFVPLGWLTDVIPLLGSDLEHYLMDDDYLVLDLVLNVAGDGIVLAFFHAISG